jgi:FAD:protein FMN transferase
MAAHHVEAVMGTTVSIDLRDDTDGTAAIDEVVAWLHHVDETFSPYKATSEVSRYGLGELTLGELSPEVLDVLGLCEQVHETTGGAFDITRVPSPNGSTFDPSGLVKGWSIEHAAAIVERHGGANFCLNGGGDMVVRGNVDDGEPWSIGIRHPDHADQFADVLRVTGPIAIATSASYERGAHIIDPRIGAAATELASVTVVGPDLTFVDAYATALYVLGEPGLALITAQPGYGAYVVRRDGTATSTSVYRALRGPDARQRSGSRAHQFRP